MGDCISPPWCKIPMTGACRGATDEEYATRMVESGPPHHHRRLIGDCREPECSGGQNPRRPGTCRTRPYATAACRQVASHINP
jgi:hypothetical protein